MSKARELADLGSVTTRLDEVGNTDGALSNRNLIINGAMQVAQRGTSQTTAGYGSIDRMPLSLSGAIATMTQETLPVGQTDLPSQFRKFARIATTTGNNNCGLYHRIEDVDTVDGQVVLSFYAKGTNPASGSFEIFLYQDFGSGGSSGVLTPREPFVVTSSWQRFEFLVTLPSLSGKTIGTGSSIEVNVIQKNADTGTAAWTLDITGVQLEVGDTATPFEHRSFGQELALCQRYYEKLNGTGAYGNYAGFGVGYSNGSYGPIVVTMRTPKRVNPTFSYGGSLRLLSGSGVSSFTVSSDTYIDKSGTGYINVDNISPNTGTGYALVLTANNDANAYFAFDAEL